MAEVLDTYQGMKVSAEEYFQLEVDDNRYELINGVLEMIASPFPIHQRVFGELFSMLYIFVKEHKLGIVYGAPLDIRLSEKDVYQPDILFISTANMSIIQDRVRGAPDLVVEILSAGTEHKDRGAKMKNYYKYGVKEYWLVDPKQKNFEFYVRGEDGFEKVKVEGNIYISEVVIGFKLDMEKFWQIFE